MKGGKPSSNLHVTPHVTNFYCSIIFRLFQVVVVVVVGEEKEEEEAVVCRHYCSWEHKSQKSRPIFPIYAPARPKGNVICRQGWEGGAFLRSFVGYAVTVAVRSGKKIFFSPMTNCPRLELPAGRVNVCSPLQGYILRHRILRTSYARQPTIGIRFRPFRYSGIEVFQDVTIKSYELQSSINFHLTSPDNQSASEPKQGSNIGSNYQADCLFTLHRRWDLPLRQRNLFDQSICGQSRGSLKSNNNPCTVLD